MYVVDRVEVGLLLVACRLELHLVACWGEVGGYREFNGYLHLGEALNLRQLVDTCVEHHLLSLVEQLHAQIAVAWHAVEVLHVEVGVYAFALLRVGREAWLVHKLEHHILRRAGLGDASLAVGELHLDCRSLLHAQKVAPCSVVAHSCAYGHEAVVAVCKSVEANLRRECVHHEVVGAHAATVVAEDALRKSACGVVVRVSHALEVALSVVYSHAHVALERFALVYERGHLYGLLLMCVERLVCGILHRERAALVEHQLRHILHQSGVYSRIFAVVRVGEYGGDGAVERERFVAELVARLLQAEVGEREVGVAAAVPSEVHVEESVLVETVGNPGVARA